MPEVRRCVSGPQKAVQVCTVALSPCRSRRWASGSLPVSVLAVLLGLVRRSKHVFLCLRLGMYFPVLTWVVLFIDSPGECQVCVPKPWEGTEWALDPKYRLPHYLPTCLGGRSQEERPGRAPPPQGFERSLG